jgi:hypothetical protein
VDDAGRPIFRELLFRWRHCVFIAFDLLFLNGSGSLRALGEVTASAGLTDSVFAPEEADANTLPQPPMCNVQTNGIHMSDHSVAGHARISETGMPQFSTGRSPSDRRRRLLHGCEPVRDQDPREDARRRGMCLVS